MNESILVEVRRIDTGTAVKANAEVTLPTEFGEITIFKFKVIHQPEKEPWVAVPEMRWKDSNGEFHNSPVISLSRRLRKKISEVILQRYQELI